MSYAGEYLSYFEALANSLSRKDLEDLVEKLIEIRNHKRTLYIVGLGGSAANAIHMAADMRKLCAIDARSLDNIAEITARANDEGWKTIFDGFLNNIKSNDALFVLSVGGGTSAVSLPLVRAIDIANSKGSKVFGIVGPDGGYTAKHGDLVIKIPCKENPTPFTEAFQAVIWHYLVSHPQLQRAKTKW